MVYKEDEDDVSHEEWVLYYKNAWSSAFARVKKNIGCLLLHKNLNKCAISLEMMCLFLSKPANFIWAIKKGPYRSCLRLLEDELLHSYEGIIS